MSDENKKLAILICTLPERRNFLKRLLMILEPQCSGKPVTIFLDNAPRGISIGTKRNNLVTQSEGFKYICHIDDDDRVAHNYIDKVLASLETEPDAIGMEGLMTTNGRDPRKFIHSIRYQSWYEESGIYYRNTNHLNAIKREIAVQVPFPEINHGEDSDYSKRLLPLVKTEVYIEEPIYFYDFRSRK